MPSAFINEDTTPLPRLNGAATSRSPTMPARTRTNSWYFSPDTTPRVSTAVAYCLRAVSVWNQRSRMGFSNSSMTMIPETGYPGTPNTGLHPIRPRIAGLPGLMAMPWKNTSPRDWMTEAE